MYVPFVFPSISPRSKKRSKSLYRRKGGGGKSGKSSGSSGGGKLTCPSSITATGSSLSSRTATAFGPGGGKPTTTLSGQPFAGRESGGGTKAQAFGNSQYGGRYPAILGRGVAGRAFPFVFWPIVWGGLGVHGAGAYMHTNEYGRPDNSSRPGGSLATATFVSRSTNTTFRVLADNTTVTSLIPDLTQACGDNFNNASTSTAPSPYNGSFALPQPEQTIQYYRASSVALTLDGYNNTVIDELEGIPDIPLPINVDKILLNCLNTTIGAAVPLTGGVPELPIPHLGIFSVLCMLWLLRPTIL